MTALIIQGCAQVKQELSGFRATPENPFCQSLFKHNDWLDAAVDSENRWGLPLHIGLAQLNMPVGTEATAYIKPQIADWEAYRLASENWFARVDDIASALDFLGWHAMLATDLNDLTMAQAGELYIASRIGHGGYYRLDYNPDMRLAALGRQVDGLALQYREDLRQCPRIRERAGSFFRWPW